MCISWLSRQRRFVDTETGSERMSEAEAGSSTLLFWPHAREARQNGLAKSRRRRARCGMDSDAKRQSTTLQADWR